MQHAPAPVRSADSGHPRDWPVACGAVLTAIRTNRPRIHALTNPVAQLLTANGLLALGAVPTLTTAPEEVADFVAGSAAVLINLGMLDSERFAAVPRAAEACKAQGRPFVVDPAFADRSPRRKQLALSLFALGPTLIKLNADEAKAMAGALPAQSVHVVTGTIDRISAGGQHLALANGHPLLQSTTATGCLLGAILATCLAVEPDSMVAAAAGISILNVAAEQAAARAGGPGSFVVALVDSLAALTPETLAGAIRIAPVEGVPS